jgi:PAS domain S-box-containing protein
LRFTEEKFFKAFHSSPDSITITRMSDGGFVEVNEGFSRVTGYSREEALNPAASTLQIWITPQDRDSFLQALQRDSVVRSAEYNYRTKSGEIRTGLLSAEIIQLGGEPHIVSVIHDITERKNAEDALKESEVRFRKSLEASPTPIAVADHTGKLIFLNQNFIDTYGYTIQDIPTVGQWMLHAYPDPEYRDLYLQQWGQDSEYAVKNNTVTPLRECQVTCKSGEVKTVEITVYFEKELFVGHFQDITDRKQAERQIRQAQAQIVEQQRAVAAFEERKRLARDLHDSLNQSTHSLVLFSETLVAAIEKQNLGHAKHIVEQVQESARQSLKETRLLLFELQAAGQGRNVNLIRDLEERFAKVESHAGIQSQIIQKGSLRHIPAAWHENLYWITIEALNNALKHAQARKMTIEIHATPKQVELAVTDNGRGFSPSKVVPGGMGLETMRARARQLGGELTIESEPGKGTCVRFRATIKAEQDEQH